MCPLYRFPRGLHRPLAFGSSLQDSDGLGNPEIEDSMESMGDTMRGGLHHRLKNPLAVHFEPLRIGSAFVLGEIEGHEIAFFHATNGEVF